MDSKFGKLLIAILLVVPLLALSATQTVDGVVWNYYVTGKKDGAGNDMLVWQDYVAGTDPTNEKDVFTASIMLVDGKIKISYSPELDEDRKALRKYTTWGRKSLIDATWSEVAEGQESEYNFYKVSVEMRPANEL